MMQDKLPTSIEWKINELAIDGFPNLEATALRNAITEEFLRQLRQKHLSIEQFTAQDFAGLDQILLEAQPDASLQTIAQKIVQSLLE